MALLPVTVWLLCGIGVYASARMARLAVLDRRGSLNEPSIVQEPAARLFFGIPNAMLGLLYYPVVALAFGFGGTAAVRIGLTLAVAAAGLTSLVLIFNLTFVSRRDCRNCWLAHAVNLALTVATASLWAQ